MQLSGTEDDKDWNRRGGQLGRTEAVNKEERLENKDKDDSFRIPLNNKVTEELCWWFLSWSVFFLSVKTEKNFL